MLRQQQKGFTLIELMITIAILAIIMSFAVPSLGNFFDKKRLVKGAEAVYGELQFARSHAIASSTDTYVKFDRTSDTQWTIATSVNTGCDTTLAPTATGACYIVVDDGDGLVDGVDINLSGAIEAGEIDTGDRVTRQIKQNSAVAADDIYPGAKLLSITGFASNEALFDSTRGTANVGNVYLQSDAGYQLKIEVNILGRIRICSPAGAAVHVSPYDSTDCTWTP